jgi:hypothetical protein
MCFCQAYDLVDMAPVGFVLLRTGKIETGQGESGLSRPGMK